jgi:hypothetical protein
MKSVRKALVAGGLATLAAACGTSGSSTTGSPSGKVSPPASASPAPSGYHPVIDPANFHAVVDNPWFPLKPGSTWTYAGTKDGEPSRDVYVVTNETKVIDGVPCVVISDKLYLSGVLEERTSDYYTQDGHGNVWYFGEDTAELDKNGNVKSTEGSWLAGQDGAQPGIFMQATPTVGQTFRQEYKPGQAEDQFRAVSLASPVTVPYGVFSDALLTEEWTALEPGVLDHKYYVKGIGEVAELSVKGPVERARLVSYTAGSP